MNYAWFIQHYYLFNGYLLVCWGRYLDHFIEKGYWVIAPDMRGFNESSKPLPENVDMQQVMNFPKSFSYGAIKKYLSDLHRTSYLYTDKYYAEDYYLLVTEYAKRDKAIFITHDWGVSCSSSIVTCFSHSPFLSVYYFMFIA